MIPTRSPDPTSPHGGELESPWCLFPEPPNPPQGQPEAVPPQIPSSVFQPTLEAEYMQYPSVCLGGAQLWGVPAGAGDTAGPSQVCDNSFSFLVLLFIVAFGFLSFCFSVFC